MTPTREEAWALLCEFNESSSLRMHALAVEGVMRHLARKRGGGAVRPLGDLEVAGPEPDDAFDQEWLLRLLELALERLAREHPGYHRVIHLFHLEGRSYEDVAGATGCSAETRPRTASPGRCSSPR